MQSLIGFLKSIITVIYSTLALPLRYSYPFVIRDYLNQLKIYKSSAGSGKTYTLVKEYLRLVLEKPDEYKHILALLLPIKRLRK